MLFFLRKKMSRYSKELSEKEKIIQHQLHFIYFFEGGISYIKINK